MDAQSASLLPWLLLPVTGALVAGVLILLYRMKLTTRREGHDNDPASMDEETLHAVLDNLQDSYFEADSSGVVTYANRALYENIGYTERDAVVGRHFRKFTAGRTVRKVHTEFNRMYATQLPVPPFQYYFRTSAGETRIGEASISPIIRNDRVIGSRGLIRDISERIWAQELLRVAKVAAEVRAAELSAVNRVATAVSQTLDLQSILQLVCGELTSIFPVRNAGVGLITADKKNLEVVAFHSADDQEKSALGMVLPFEGNPSSQEVIRTKRTLVLQDAQSDPRSESLSAISRSRGTRAIMLVPILTRGEAIGTLGMPAIDPFYVFTESEVELAETIASQIAAAIDNAQLHSRTESALTIAEGDLEIGRQIQSGFFPERLPDIDGWEIAAEFKAARQVAGDFYDVFRLKNSPYTALVIADVCDKGVGAALFMVLFRSLLRAFSEKVTGESEPEAQLKDIVVSTNNFIAEYHGKSNMFATLFIGILNSESGEFFYVNGGHEPPVILNKAGAVTNRLMPTGPAVGLFPDMEFKVARYMLGPGDCLVGFTDGTTDAKNASGTQFSEDRLLESIAVPWTSAFSMLFELDTEIRKHIGTQPQFDDITLIALRRNESTDRNRHAICRVAEPQSLGELREFVESAATHSGLSHEDVFAFKSAADEICTNIIQHGYVDCEPGFLSLALDVEPGELARLVIIDDGKHFPPERAEPPDVAADWNDREPGGLGIHLVKEQMDTVSYTRTDDGANQLIIEKNLK
jgi:phosphoserine phosphatase RsbU/P